MVSPQIEDGYTRIANESLEALCRVNLSAYAWRTLLALIRKLYGFQKKEDFISVSQFQKLTGLKRQHQSRALKELEDKKIITRIGDGFINKYAFQKDYLKWKTITYKGDNNQTVTHIGDTLSPNEVTNLSPIKVTTKEKRKHTKEKGDSMASSKALDRFLKARALEIYESYPRKADRPNSLRSIEKILRAYPVELLPCPVPGLKTVIQNYQKHLEAEGTEKKFIIQSNNFFGLAERWREYLAPMNEAGATHNTAPGGIWR